MYSEMVPGRYWYCNPQTLCVSAVQGGKKMRQHPAAAASERSAQGLQRTCGGASRLSPVSHSHQTAPMRGMAAAAAATHSRRSLVAGLSSLPLLLTSALAIRAPLARSFTPHPAAPRTQRRPAPLPALGCWPIYRLLQLAQGHPVWSIFGARVTEPRLVPWCDACVSDCCSWSGRPGSIGRSARAWRMHTRSHRTATPDTARSATRRQRRAGARR